MAEGKYTDNVLIKASELKQQYHKEQSRADWSEIEEILISQGEEIICDENFRCAVKSYEKKNGILKKREAYVSNVVDGKLNEIRKIIGEQNILKVQIRQDKSELTKIQKGFIKSISIADDIKEYFEQNCTITIPEYCHKPINISSEYEMILHVTDWHVGYVIDDCKGNYYNYEIANQRIDKLISECYKYIEMYGIKKVFLINTGDIIEQIAMRKNQSQFCEFNLAEQINKALELMYRLIIALNKYCDVEYDSIYGNHDRMNGDYKANLDGDNAEVIIREQLDKYKTLSKNNRLTVVNRRHTDKEIMKNIKGFKCKFVHGDKGVKDAKQQLKNEMSMDSEIYSLYFKGHLHNFELTSENNGRYIISTGCLSGYNDFSVNFGCTTVASQTIVILNDDGIELIKDVQLS